DAFALTVHKAQGSEFDEVLLILPDEDAPILSRELLYTAVSRARRALRLVGPKEVVLSALGRSARRYSGLVDAIGEAIA
ncbi:MAG: ATP-binding domain-containing protein, partial [Polyangiales bacterium]